MCCTVEPTIMGSVMRRTTIALAIVIALGVCVATAAWVADRSDRSDESVPPAARSTHSVASDGQDDGFDTGALVDELTTAGHRVEVVAGNVPGPALLGVAPAVVCIDDNVVSVYEYPTAAERRRWAASISEDGSAAGTSGGGRAIVEWAGTPQFFARGKLLALYLGDEGSMIDTLTVLLGDTIRPAVQPGRGVGGLLCT